MNKKHTLAVTLAGIVAAPMTAQAVKYELSGQINRAIVYNDDGNQTDVQFVDNINSGTRWRMKGSEDIGNGMQVGFNHNIPKAKVDLYAGFQSFELDTPAATRSVDHIYNFILGTKLTFD